MTFNSATVQALDKAAAKRELLRQVTNAVRLVNGIGDHIPGLILEQYDRHFCAQVFDQAWIKEKNALKEYLQKRFTVDYLILKDRTQSTLADPSFIKTHILVDKKGSTAVVCEHGVFFEVDLNDTLNTGLFLDMRANRLLVSAACAGQKVLNCFSYTCSFGVYARTREAREVVNVDVSKKVLEKGRQNYKLNHLEPRVNEFIKADATEYLQKALKKENRFDIIILDPPSFARAEGKAFSVEKHLPQLMKTAIQCLNAQGRLFVSTNFSGISHARLEEYLKQTNQKIKKIARLGQDKDFVGSDHSKESHLAALWIET